MAQAFDFGALLQNPAFQFGSTLLGSARQPNAIGNSFSTIGKMQALQQEKLLQQAQIKNMEDQRVAQNRQLDIADKQYERQNNMTGVEIEQMRRKMDMQDNFMKQIAPLLNGQQAPQEVAPEQQAPAGPQGSAITPQLLDGLAQVESSGNPNAVNSQSGAQGMYQFMPATTKMIQQKNPNFNPFDPAQARQEAGNLLNNMTAQHGGSLLKGLASYGGFKTKDPTAYQQAVFRKAGIPFPGTEQQQAPQGDAPGGPVNMGGGMSNPGLALGRIAAGAGVAGVPGAAQLMELGKMMAPQNVAPGSYQRDPVTGKMQYIQDPMRTAELGQGQQRIDIAQEQNKREAAKQNYEMGGHPGELPQKALDAVNQSRYELANTEIGKSLETYKDLPTQYHALQRAQVDVDSLIKSRNAATPIGFASSQKLFLLKAFRNTFGQDAPKSVADAEDFNSAMAQLWMKAVKQVDSNSTAAQQKSITASFGTLNNDPAALKRILAETETSFTRQMMRHNKAVAQFTGKMGPDPFSRYLDSGKTTPAGTHVGEQEHGYTYLGGDPADQNSWTK